MKLNGLISLREPPANRVGTAEGGAEKVLTEAAVMLAFGMYLIKSRGVAEVALHPDGEHAKRFDIRGWLERNGYVLTEPFGATAYGGRYTDESSTVIVVPKPGQGDVVARDGSRTVVAECKGGVVNSRHPGQRSRLRRGLCEAIGLLMARPADGEEQFAVVPQTRDTCALAKLMEERCTAAGLSVLLVCEDGSVVGVSECDEGDGIASRSS